MACRYIDVAKTPRFVIEDMIKAAASVVAVRLGLAWKEHNEISTDEAGAMFSEILTFILGGERKT